MGNTNSPHTHPGNNAKLTAIILLDGTIANAIKVIPIPVQNNIRSNGLNILKIKVPFLALAGTKYPFI